MNTKQDYDSWLDAADAAFKEDEAILADINVKVEVDRVAYTQLYPNHCINCEGWGGHAAREFRGMYGMSAAYEDTFDTCPECVDKGKCPRCSTENALNEDGEGPCPNCGWNYNCDGMPQYASW